MKNLCQDIKCISKTRISITSSPIYERNSNQILNCSHSDLLRRLALQLNFHLPRPFLVSSLKLRQRLPQQVFNSAETQFLWLINSIVRRLICGVIGDHGVHYSMIWVEGEARVGSARSPRQQTRYNPVSQFSFHFSFFRASENALLGNSI